MQTSLASFPDSAVSDRLRLQLLYAKTVQAIKAGGVEGLGMRLDQPTDAWQAVGACVTAMSYV